MNGIDYRDAGLQDSALVADLFASSFVETFGHLYARDDLDAFLAGITPEAFADEIGNPDFALRIAKERDEPIGFAKLGPANLPVAAPPATFELWQIYVLKPWQGQGVAQRLYDWAEGEARRRGGEYLQLSVYVDNHRARRFYERHNFEAVGRYDFMVGTQADEDIVMRKAL
jgi:diamine N-acetyltransferase